MDVAELLGGNEEYLNACAPRSLKVLKAMPISIVVPGPALRSKPNVS